MDPNTGAVVERSADRRFGFTEGRIEALKWLGLIMMVVEHWMRYVVGQLPPWVYQAGRTAFPLFVIALALGIRGSPPAKLCAILIRMLFWAVVAQAGLWLADPGPGIANVLFTFTLGLSAVWAVRRIESLFLLALVLLAIGILALGCEFGPAGVALIASAVLLAQADEPPVAAWIAVGMLLAALALPNGNWYALAAVPLAVMLRGFGPELPRVRGLFYRVYALQFPVYALARLALG